MGCECIREKETFTQQNKPSSSPQITSERPLSHSANSAQPSDSTPTVTPIPFSANSRRSSVPTKKLYLQIPFGTQDKVSSPQRHTPRKFKPLTPRNQLAVPCGKRSSLSPRSPRSGGFETSWKDLNLVVRLRDVRTVEELDRCYQLDTESQGSLLKASHRSTKRVHWVQTLALRTDKSEKQRMQFLIKLKSLDHPNILKMLELLQHQTHYSLIYEGTGGGSVASLLQCLKNEGKVGGIKEKWAVEIMRQVFAALGYCHSQGLTLQFLSLQHLLFVETPSDKQIQVKLMVPLGNSFDINSPYIAPELRTKKHAGPANDLFSCGIILSNLLTNSSILSSENLLTLQNSVRWRCVSPEAKAVVSMLTEDYERRGTIAECMQHPWLSIPQSRPTLVPCLRAALRNMARLRPVTSLGKTFLQLMLIFVVPSEDLEEAKQAFRELDTNMSGTVSEEELRVQLFRLFPEEQAEAALSAIASTAVFSTGRKLSYSEFLTWAISRHRLLASSNITILFHLLDTDNDKKVTAKELREVLSIDPDDSTDAYAWRFLVSEISNSTEGSFNYARFASFIESL